MNNWSESACLHYPPYNAYNYIIPLDECIQLHYVVAPERVTNENANTDIR